MLLAMLQVRMVMAAGMINTENTGQKNFCPVSFCIFCADGADSHDP